MNVIANICIFSIKCIASIVSRCDSVTMMMNATDQVIFIGGDKYFSVQTNFMFTFRMIKECLSCIYYKDCEDNINIIHEMFRQSNFILVR